MAESCLTSTKPERRVGWWVAKRDDESRARGKDLTGSNLMYFAVRIRTVVRDRLSIYIYIYIYPLIWTI